MAIGDRTTLREYVTVNSGTAEGECTSVGSDCLIMAYCHVAHSCKVGDRVIIANGGTLAGDVVVEDDVGLAGYTGVHQFVRIGRMAYVGACTKVVKDVPPYMLVDGTPAEIHGPNTIGLQRRGVNPDVRSSLKQAHRILYRSGLSTSQALEKMEQEIEKCAELDHMIEFIRASERGIMK